MRYALDTNIVSYLLRDNDIVYRNFERALRYGNTCVIPPIVYYEVKRGLLAAKASAKLKDFEKFCNACKIGEMSTYTWDAAAKIYAEQRASGKSKEDADIFIAAFCLVNGQTLVTNNTKHFHDVAGLTIENWTE